MQGLIDLLKEQELKAQQDANIFKNLNQDKCQLCFAEGEDKRSLWMDCFYDLQEAVPEMLALTFVPASEHPKHRQGYFLRICKACRGSLLMHLSQWANLRRGLRNHPKDSDGGLCQESTDPVAYTREFGACRPMTPEEIAEHSKTRQVVYYNPIAE